MMNSVNTATEVDPERGTNERRIHVEGRNVEVTGQRGDINHADDIRHTECQTILLRMRACFNNKNS